LCGDSNFAAVTLHSSEPSPLFDKRFTGVDGGTQEVMLALGGVVRKVKSRTNPAVLTMATRSAALRNHILVNNL
jgi:hypothetical protein